MGNSDEEVTPTPKQGDIVTFTYTANYGTAPINPKIIRIRSDVTWENVIHLPKDLDGITLKQSTFI